MTTNNTDAELEEAMIIEKSLAMTPDPTPTRRGFILSPCEKCGSQLTSEQDANLVLLIFCPKCDREEL